MISPDVCRQISGPVSAVVRASGFAGFLYWFSVVKA